MLSLTDHKGFPVVVVAVADKVAAADTAVGHMVADRNRRKSYFLRTLPRELHHWAKPNFQINQVDFSGWLSSTITTLKLVHKSKRMSKILVKRQRRRLRLEQ